MEFNSLVKLIQQQSNGHESFIVAIDGCTASGKTTLAERMAIVLNASIIHLDDFYQPNKTSERLSQPGGNCDHERFESEVLIPLSKGEEVSYRPYNCHQKSFSEPLPVTKSKITIIEGSYALYPSLSKYYDFRIFLTLDPKLQLERLKTRNPELYDTFVKEWIPLEEAYFKACDPKKNCDLVIDNIVNQI